MLYGEWSPTNRNGSDYIWALDVLLAKHSRRNKGISQITSALSRWFLLLFYPASPRLLDRIHPQPDNSLSPLTGYLEMRGKPCDLNSLLERCRGPKEREARSQPKEEVAVAVPCDADWPGGRACRNRCGQAVGGGCGYRGCGAVEFYGVGGGRGAEVLPLNRYGCPRAALCGAKPKIASALGEDVELVIERRFPTAS